jgi:hypothetical protein
MKEMNQPTNTQKRENRMKESLDFLFQVTKEKFHVKKTVPYESCSATEYQRSRMDSIPAAAEDYKNIQF